MAETDGREPVLLVVEDEAPNRALLRAVLSRASDDRIRGASIVEATTLAEARAHLEAGPVDVILLDVRLPDGSGLDLARELQARAGGRPAVLILSASVLPMERFAAEEAGADAFLAKPYEPRQLLDVLTGLVAGGLRGG